MSKKTIDALFFPGLAGASAKYRMMERRPVILIKVGCYRNGQDTGLVKPNYTEKKEKKGKKKGRRKTLDATHKPERPMLWSHRLAIPNTRFDQFDKMSVGNLNSP